MLQASLPTHVLNNQPANIQMKPAPMVPSHEVAEARGSFDALIQVAINADLAIDGDAISLHKGD